MKKIVVLQMLINPVGNAVYVVVSDDKIFVKQGFSKDRESNYFLYSIPNIVSFIS